MSELLRSPGVCTTPCELDKSVQTWRELSMFDQLNETDVLSKHDAVIRFSAMKQEEIVRNAEQQASRKPCEGPQDEVVMIYGEPTRCPLVIKAFIDLGIIGS